MSGTSAAGLNAIPSERFRLAQAARQAALSVPGVRGLDSGASGLFATFQGRDRVEGVLCAATPGGGYEVTLQLVCDMVPLRPLAEQVRREVSRGARTGGLDLESVRVHIAALNDSQAPGAAP